MAHPNDANFSAVPDLNALRSDFARLRAIRSRHRMLMLTSHNGEISGEWHPRLCFDNRGQVHLEFGDLGKL